MGDAEVSLFTAEKGAEVSIAPLKRVPNLLAVAKDTEKFSTLDGEVDSLT